MLTIPLILAAGSLSSLVLGAPVPSEFRLARRGAHDLYSTVGGDGSLLPTTEYWVDTVDEMFEFNRATVIEPSCGHLYGDAVPNNSPQETDDILKAIHEVGDESGIDKRFILAVVIQESKGCVRAGTTGNGVTNPGLMQSHDGDGKCAGACPYSSIRDMISDGTMGTFYKKTGGPGLKQLLAQYGTWYYAARAYNTGHVIYEDINNGDGATASYVCDVANRLAGWVEGPAGTLFNVADAIEALTEKIAGGLWWLNPAYTNGNGGTPTDPSTTTTTTTTTTSAPTFTAPVNNPVLAAPVAEPTPEPQPETTPEPQPEPETPGPSTPSSTGDAPKYPFAISSCQKYYTVKSGDFCIKVENQEGISAEQFLQWNQGLNEKCSNLWKGYQYCVQA